VGLRSRYALEARSGADGERFRSTRPCRGDGACLI